MQNTLLYGKLFLPNRSKKNAFTMYYIGFFMLAVGLEMIIFGSPQAKKLGIIFIAGLIVTGFALIMLLLVFILRTPAAAYYVRHDGVVLKRGKYILEIPFGGIASIKVLSERESEKLILFLENEPVKGMIKNYHNYESIGYSKVIFAGNRYGMLMFMSVYIASTRFFKTEENGVGAINLPCETVVIQLTNDDSYMITPLDTQSFVKEVEKKWQLTG